jgi:cytochrome P450
MSTTSVSKVDPFSHEFLANPYPFHEEMREAGPVVWLDRYDIWAMARHEEVRACPWTGRPSARRRG